MPRFAQEGARIFAVDRDLDSANESAAMVRAEAGARWVECETARADVTQESELKAAHRRFGRIDILHYNVGISMAGGDAPATEITGNAFDPISAVNLRGAVMACKHALPIMREQRSGVILMISSISAWENYPNVAYKVTKAGMIAFTQQLAIRDAEYEIRANAILPGLTATSMAIDVRARTINKPRDEIMRERDACVPLRQPLDGHSASRGSPLWTTGINRHAGGQFWTPMRGQYSTPIDNGPLRGSGRPAQTLFSSASRDSSVVTETANRRTRRAARQNRHEPCVRAKNSTPCCILDPLWAAGAGIWPGAAIPEKCRGRIWNR